MVYDIISSLIRETSAVPASAARTAFSPGFRAGHLVIPPKVNKRDAKPILSYFIFQEEFKMIQTKRIVSLVLAMLIAVSAFSFAAAAIDTQAPAVGAVAGHSADDRESTVDGLEISKVYDPDTKKLTLEAFVTGESQTQLITEPVDIALVLDVSGSMSETIEVANGYDELGVLDTVYGAAEGIYTANMSGTLLTFERNLRYNAEKGYWEYFKETDIFGSKGWTEIGSNGYVIKNIYISKLNAMKIATKRFVDAIPTDDAANLSNISIISYASDANTIIANKQVSEASKADIKAAIDGLSADGATRADLAMAAAETALAASTRKKVVIMFTDGAPGMRGDWCTNNCSPSCMSVANSAIATSKRLKENGATVYTIGCFNATDAANSNVKNYMNYVSSNYPNAASMTVSGAAAEDMRYYKTATTGSDLAEIFHKISLETGGAKVLYLKEKTVLKDIVAGDFYIPGSSGNYNVTVSTYTYTGRNTAGERRWAKDAQTDAGITVKVIPDAAGKGRDVTVTGFDYSANWVGESNGNPHGKKLVLEIVIELDEESNAYGYTETNAAGSGIYDEDGNLVENFESGICYIPYFAVAHECDGRTEYIPMHKIDGGYINITSKVESGYLYGGTFADEARTVVAEFNGGDPTKFAPEDGTTYYLHEVSDKYLAAKNYIVWDHTGALYSYYLFTTVDSAAYREVGFDVEQNGESAARAAEAVYETVAVKKRQNGALVPYQMLYVKDGALSVENGGTAPADRDIGYLAMRAVDIEMLKQYDLVFTPYWVTLDGVKVFGGNVRTCHYTGEKQNGAVQVSNMPSGTQPAYVGAATNAKALRAKAVYVVGDGKIDVTIVDGENTVEMRVAPGNIREHVSYAGVEGKVFAGWFTDKAMTVPADLCNVDSDITLYAKYVNDSYLAVNYIERRFIRVRGLYLASALDGDGYAETGFIINGKKLVVSRFSYTDRLALRSARMLFGSGVDRNAPMMTAAYSFDGCTGGEVVTVTPYWITLDGTTVNGATRVLTFRNYWVEG